MSRLRQAVTIDRDGVSPDSFKAATEFLIESLVEKAEALVVALDWNTLHVYTRTNREGDHRVIAWAKVAR